MVARESKSSWRKKRKLEVSNTSDVDSSQQQGLYESNSVPSEDQIWIDGQLVRKPSHAQQQISHGVLLYRTKADNPSSKSSIYNCDVEFLLGLIPQRNFWTVFKGMPNDDDNESPRETAAREFQEETSVALPDNWQADTILWGKTSKKYLHISLVDGAVMFLDPVDHFDVDKVVKIDQGYLKGQPEIVDIQWLNLSQAMEGVHVPSSRSNKENSDKALKTAKLYPSQVGILKHAHAFLAAKHRQDMDERGKNEKSNEPE